MFFLLFGGQINKKHNDVVKDEMFDKIEVKDNFAILGNNIFID